LCKSASKKLANYSAFFPNGLKTFREINLLNNYIYTLKGIISNSLMAIATLSYLWLRLRSAFSSRWVSEAEACINSFRFAIYLSIGTGIAKKQKRVAAQSTATLFCFF
jgi:hypothetical protein